MQKSAVTIQNGPNTRTLLFVKKNQAYQFFLDTCVAHGVTPDNYRSRETHAYNLIGCHIDIMSNAPADNLLYLMGTFSAETFEYVPNVLNLN
jgi:hypothetical protein